MGLAPGAGRLDGGRMPGGADAVNERSLVRVRVRVRVSVRVRVRVRAEASPSPRVRA